MSFVLEVRSAASSRQFTCTSSNSASNPLPIPGNSAGNSGCNSAIQPAIRRQFLAILGKTRQIRDKWHCQDASAAAIQDPNSMPFKILGGETRGPSRLPTESGGRTSGSRILPATWPRTPAHCHDRVPATWRPALRRTATTKYRPPGPALRRTATTKHRADWRIPAMPRPSFARST